MMHHLRTVQSHTIRFTAVLGMLSALGCASINQKIAHCEALKDDTTRVQMNSCSAHTGCNMVLNLQTDCTKTKSFLSRLKESMAGRSTITNNDVFEANTPTLTSSEALRSKVTTVQNMLRDEALTINGTSGHKAGKGYYEDGPMVRVLIVENGLMLRGRNEINKINGQAQMVTASGYIIAGDFVENKPLGHIALQYTDGTVYTGDYLGDDKWAGIIDVTEPNGDHFKRLHDREGNKLAVGPVAKAGQIATIPSASVTPEPAAPPIAKRQEQNFAAAAASAAATGLPPSSGMVGKTPAVSLSPPGNAKSRNECVKLTWATSPLPLTKREKQIDERSRSELYRAEYFGAYPAGDRAEQRAW